MFVGFLVIRSEIDGKLLLLEISTSRNCSSVSCLKCLIVHNWFNSAPLKLPS